MRDCLHFGMGWRFGIWIMNASGRKTAFWIRNDKVREQKRGIGIGIGIGIKHRRENGRGDCM